MRSKENIKVEERTEERNSVSNLYEYSKATNSYKAETQDAQEASENKHDRMQ